MQPLNQRISKARKARNMTQEQLAAAMNVSRQTVSHWENGRVQPDEETQKRLNELLNINDTSTANAAASIPVGGLKKYLLGFLPGIIVTLLVVYGIIPLFNQTQNKAESLSQSTVIPTEKPAKVNYDWEWYQQPNVREEGKAYLGFSLVADPVTITERDFEPYVGWQVDYRFEEINDVAFTITSFTEVYYTADKTITYSSTIKDEELSIAFDNVNMEPRGRIRYSVFKPVDASVLYAVRIEGIDGNGNERVFRYTIPLSQEMQK